MTAAEEYAGLPERGRCAIDFVHRHWLVTPEVVHQALAPELSQDAVRKFLARLVERDWLVRHMLSEQESYLLLGGRALTALGIRRSAKPLGIQALIEHYAVLLACARGGCALITEDEFRSQFPDLCEPGQSAKHFFVDSSVDPPRLGLFVVDHDKLSTRLVQKVRRRVARMMQADRPALRRLILDGELSVSVLTATDGKRANVEAAFARKPHRSVPVSVEAFPELEPFFLVNRR